MYLYTKNTRETLKKIEAESSLCWHTGEKPTWYDSKFDYLAIETDDIEWGLMDSDCPRESHTIESKTFVKICAELAPKEGEK